MPHSSRTYWVKPSSAAAVTHSFFFRFIHLYVIRYHRERVEYIRRMNSYVLLCCFVMLCEIASADPVYKPRFWSKTSYGARTTLNATSTDLDVFTNLTVEAMYLTPTMMRLRVYPVDLKPGQKSPFVIPDLVLPNSTAPANATTRSINNTYNLALAGGGTGYLSVIASDSFSTLTYVALQNLVFRSGEVSFQTRYDARDKMSGYGEHNYYYFINNENNITLSLWNTDNGGIPWQNPLYGVHPVVFHSNPQTKDYFAVFWANSHAQSISILDNVVTYTAVGGIIDLYVITGSSPMEVVQQYHALIGPSAVPPYWSLGVHQCRWGYTTVADVQDVVEGYAAAGIPLDVMWNDIDYMYKFRVFTTDPIRYPVANLSALVQSLHDKGQRYIQITDPGVAQASNYSTFTGGDAAGVFIKTQNGASNAINVVWPGWTAFPDFTNASAREWWVEQIHQYRKDVVAVDGMWLDMNELGTFCGGQCAVPIGTPWSYNWSTVDWNTFNADVCTPANCTVVNSAMNYPPVNPLDNGLQLFSKTLDMTAQLAMGTYYQTKTFYGLLEAKASYDAMLAETGERPFLLSRASFAGSGRYTAHWTGDNSASWAPQTGGIADSLQGVLGANLWGIPMVGADIGGFFGDVSEELVVRWYQLGAFYPFTRNHHGLGGPGQEPYKFSLQAQDAIKTALAGKYRLLPYLFTYLMLAHQNQGPVLRHLSLQFPDDPQTYFELPQFMVGDAILVNPILKQGATFMTAYLPLGMWYHLWLGMLVTAFGGEDIALLEDSVNYSTPFTLARGGTIIPVHQTPGLTVAETQASGIGLRVYMDGNGTAFGTLQNATDAPLEAQTILKILYFASGTISAGSVRSVGNGAATSSITTRVTISIFFPECAELAVNATLTMSVNGVVDDNPTYNMTCSSIEYWLPVGLDASALLDVGWAVPVTPSSPSDKTAIIVGATVGSVAAAAVIAGVAVVWWRKRRVSQDGYHELVQSNGV